MVSLITKIKDSFFIPKQNNPPSEVIIKSNSQATMKQKKQHFHLGEVR